MDVCAAAADAGYDVHRAAAGRPRHHRFRRRGRGRVATAPGHDRQLRRLDQRRRRRVRRRRRRDRGQRRRRRQRRARRGGRGRLDRPRLERLRVRRHQADLHTSNRTRPVRCPRTARSKLAGEHAVARAAPEQHTIVRSSWLFGTGGDVLSEDDPAARGRAGSDRRRRRPARMPDVHRPPRSGARADRATAPPPGLLHVAGAGECSWFEFAREIVAAVGRRLRGSADHDRRVSAPAPRPAVQRRCAPSAATVPRCRTGVEGLRELHVRTATVTAMKLLVCGGAGFIGSTFVRMPRARARRRGDRARQAHLRGSAREPADGPGRIRFVHGAIEDPEAVADAVAGAEAIVNFAAETHVDRSIAEPYAFSVTNGQGTHVLLEAAARARPALRPGVDRRGLRLDRVRLVHGGVAACSRRAPTARPRPAPTCSSQLLPHLRAADARSAAARTTTARASTPRS